MISNPGCTKGLSKTQWVKSQLEICDRNKSVRKDVLLFIFSILYGYFGENRRNTAVLTVFTHGYCYYFAKMLEDAFGGTVCYVEGFDHIVWKDEFENLYDAGGIFATNEYKFETIPLCNMPEDFVNSYKHNNFSDLGPFK